MNEQELNEIEARAEAATPGPMGEQIVELSWSTPEDRQYGYWVNDANGDAYAHVWTEADMKHVAHARQDVPALVAEVRRLRAALEEIKDYTGPESRDIDDGWSYVHSLASNTLKGGNS